MSFLLSNLKHLFHVPFVVWQNDKFSEKCQEFLAPTLTLHFRLILINSLWHVGEYYMIIEYGFKTEIRYSFLFAFANAR